MHPAITSVGLIEGEAGFGKIVIGDVEFQAEVIADEEEAVKIAIVAPGPGCEGGCRRQGGAASETRGVRGAAAPKEPGDPQNSHRDRGRVEKRKQTGSNAAGERGCDPVAKREAAGGQAEKHQARRDPHDFVLWKQEEHRKDDRHGGSPDAGAAIPKEEH